LPFALVVLSAGVALVLGGCAPSGQPASVAQPAAAARLVYMDATKVPTLGAAGYELVTMGLDRSNPRQLTSNTTQEFLPHFSPDAARVLYTKYTSGTHGEPAARSVIAVLDLATLIEIELTSTGTDAYAVWSPDGRRIAYLAARAAGEGPRALWMMNADGTGRHPIAAPAGTPSDRSWGDLAWSSDDWIVFAVTEDISGCRKTRLDKLRPDGSTRTQVTDGGRDCTPQGMELLGDADPAVSPDGRSVYSSRGLVRSLPGTPRRAARHLYAFSSTAWTAAKSARDLTPGPAPGCIETLPKISPDGRQLLLHRECREGDAPSGTYLSAVDGRSRAFVANGLGADWAPAQR
jgi:dipeptidyl aminopeptidase/acylaminoacyl peptidase